MVRSKAQAKIARWAGGAAAAVVAIGCVWWFQFGKEETWAKHAVQARLNDPGSALFRHLQAPGGSTVCGEVNAKNAMGGYTGFKRFVVTESAKNGTWATIEPLSSEVEEEEKANQVAASLGQTTARARYVSREAFSALASACSWN